MLIISSITLQESVISLIVGAIGAYVGLKVLVVELRIKVNSVYLQLIEKEKTLKELEARIRDLEKSQAVTESQCIGIFKAIENVAREIKDSGKK